MKAVVFLGPTLPEPDARSILDAVYLPPAGQGDLLSAVTEHRPDVIGLIDGVFLQSLAVWHKEILFALDRGIAVYGSSSMGALRAAETAPFGMRGVGEVYRLYASGEIEDDDEVALAHAAAEFGYRKLSEPMVNLRATVAAAVEAGVVDRAAAAAFLSAAKELYFAERTFDRIFAATAGAVPADAFRALERFMETSYVDVKRQDAEELLRAIASLDAEALAEARRRPSFEFARTTHFETLYNRDRLVVRDEVAVPLEAVANYVALHAENFDELNFHALNRALALVLADWLDLDVAPDDVAAEEARFRRRRRLGDDATLHEWLARNDLDEDEFRELMADVALCRRLHRWFLVANWMQRSTKLVLDELRLAGRYPEWADRAAAQERLLTWSDQHELPEITRGDISGLLADHEQWVGRDPPDDAVAWSEEAGFHSTQNLRMELARARAARRALLELLAAGDGPAA